MEAPEFPAVERGFAHQVAVRIAQVEKLVTSFAMQMEPVRAAPVFGAPGTDKFSPLIERHNGVPALSFRADGVLDVHTALGVHGDTVGVAKNVAGRQLAPVMDDFVLMLA